MKLIRPLLLAPVLAVLCLGLAHCKKDGGGAGGDGKKARGKKADTHESLAKEAIALSGELADIYAGVTDAVAASAIMPKLDIITTKFEDVNKRMELMGAPTGELKVKIEDIFGSAQRALGERMKSSMARFLGDKEIGQIVLPALETFAKRIEKFKAIELWEGDIELE